MATLAMMLLFLLFSIPSVQADRTFLSEFTQTLFSKDSTTPVISANKVIQTRDGYIWFATYGGLIRFDGHHSKVFGENSGLTTNNVYTVFEDSGGRLWVGTNDAGVALYHDAKFTFLTVDDGLPSSSIRDIAQDSTGSVYVATTLGLAYIRPTGNLTMVTTADAHPIITSNIEIAPNGDTWCILNDGSVQIINNGQAVSEFPHDYFNGSSLSSAFSASDGQIWLGAYNGQVFRFNYDSGQYSLMSAESGRNTINGFYQDRSNRVWICSDNGIGYFEDDVLHLVDGGLINNSFENMIEDYEGNYWFSSSRSGVLLLAKASLKNVFFAYNLPEMTVNASAEYHGQLFLGADNGLMVIDDHGLPIETDLTRKLRNTRLRSLVVDDDDNLWIATYSNFGIIRYKDGQWVSITTKDGLISERVRSIWPRHGGGVIATTSNGLSIIKDDMVTKSYTIVDGLTMPVILNVIEMDDGVLYAGSDGGGIYRIDQDSVTNISTSDGLTSGVILRMTFDEAFGGFWVSTGNGICFLSQSGVKRLDQLSGYDNSVFDIKLIGDDEIWLLSSSGIHIASRSNLLSDSPLILNTLGKQDGLTSPLTANSVNLLTDQGILLISCTKGVLSIDTANVLKNLVKPKLVINSIIIDDLNIESPDFSKIIEIPAQARRIIVDFALLSYFSSHNNKVSAFLEGFDNSPTTFDMSQATSVSYTNLASGRYSLRLVGLNANGVLSNEIVVHFRKIPKLLESPLFWFAFLIAAATLIFFSAKSYNKHKMLQKDKLLIGVNQAASLLIADIHDDMDQAVWRALKILGESVLAKSAFLWRDSSGNDAPRPGRITFWHLGEELTGNTRPVSIDIPVIEPLFDLSTLSRLKSRGLELDAKQLVAANVPAEIIGDSKFFTVIPITIQEDLWGFIGFASYSLHKYFTPEQMDILASGGLLMASALARSDMIIDFIGAREAALEGARAKSNFLARMSHEIRTPLNAVIGMSELALRENISPPTAATYVSGISQAGRNLLSIINDILDFSKIESGLLQLDIVPYETTSVLNDVLNIIKTRAVERGLLLLVDVAPSIPRSLTGDSARLRQVLVNLLSNAVKYTHDGFVKLEVREIARDNDSTMLCFSISDSGLGIKPQDMDSLFGDFVRVDLERNRGIEGTGLGLSISRNLCRSMGGDISVESVYGQGSVFRATINQTRKSDEPLAFVNNPGRIRALIWHERTQYSESIALALESLKVASIVVANEPQQFISELENGRWTHAFTSTSEAEQAQLIVRTNNLTTKVVRLVDAGEPLTPSDSESLMTPLWVVPVANLLNGVTMAEKGERLGVSFTAPNAKMLVVDDIATNLQVVCGLLAPYRLKTDTCMSGLEAIELVRTKEYDIVLMDHIMPGIDGKETTKRIRELGGRLAKIPIIALTANALSGVREDFLRSGFDDYLAKPIELSKLNGVLDSWIPENKRERPQLMPEKNVQAPSFEDIKGLDSAKGLRLTGGSKEAYLNILKIYHSDVEERLDILRNFLTGGEQSLADDQSMVKFITYVHALKSASASIGATEIASTAAALEEAGTKRNTEVIWTLLGGFCDSLSAMAEAIGQSLQLNSRRSGRPKGSR
jgi:signal transduction histidine kinase/ligand-binding sensor domain-containing protein/CheY-like chemotaxis protein/HPt (histidine-containing phosphotransfer) domain-containing protein